MIVIGEKLNSSIPKTLEAMNRRDDAYLTDLIRRQAAAGADYLDINTALTEADELDCMRRLIHLALANTECGIMIDAPDPGIAAQCLPEMGSRRVILNSVTLDPKYDALIAMAKHYDVGVVCLPIQEAEVPATGAERLRYAGELIAKLRQAGIRDENIYVDALTEAVAANAEAAINTLATIRLLKAEYPTVKTLCGLSNISFGLPDRRELNRAFLLMAVQNGLDSAIVDITREEMKEALIVAGALLGTDEYCMEYIQYSRERKDR